jgi:hypothetical protein
MTELLTEGKSVASTTELEVATSSDEHALASDQVTDKSPELKRLLASPSGWRYVCVRTPGVFLFSAQQDDSSGSLPFPRNLSASASSV